MNRPSQSTRDVYKLNTSQRIDHRETIQRQVTDDTKKQKQTTKREDTTST